MAQDSNSFQNQKYGDAEPVQSSRSFSKDSSESETEWSGEFERTYTRAELIEWIQLYVRAYGEVPKKSETFSWPGPKFVEYADEFGLWVNAVRHAGFEPRRAPDLTKPDIARQIRRFAHYEGEVTEQAFSNHPSTCSSTTVKRYFGSWQDAVEAAGVDNQYDDDNTDRGRPERYTRADIARQIRQWANQNDRLLQRDFKQYPETCCVNTVRRRFGSWEKALEAAGVLEE